jgi:hypothetical protein
MLVGSQAKPTRTGGVGPKNSICSTFTADLLTFSSDDGEGFLSVVGKRRSGAIGIILRELIDRWNRTLPILVQLSYRNRARSLRFRMLAACIIATHE